MENNISVSDLAKCVDNKTHKFKLIEYRTVGRYYGGPVDYEMTLKCKICGYTKQKTANWLERRAIRRLNDC